MPGIEKFQQPKWEIFYSRQPYARLQYHTITALEENKVVVVGGLARNGISSNGVYEGILATDRKSVTWIELDSLAEGRHNHLTFKMKRNILVAGGVQNSIASGVKYLLSCERYDPNAHEWNTSTHQLPFPVTNASVLVDEEENFALITGGYHRSISHGHFQMQPRNKNNNVIIYTEKDGFVIFNNCPLEKLNKPHIAVRIT